MLGVGWGCGLCLHVEPDHRRGGALLLLDRLVRQVELRVAGRLVVVGLRHRLAQVGERSDEPLVKILDLALPDVALLLSAGKNSVDDALVGLLGDVVDIADVAPDDFEKLLGRASVADFGDVEA